MFTVTQKFSAKIWAEIINYNIIHYNYDPQHIWTQWFTIGQYLLNRD